MDQDHSHPPAQQDGSKDGDNAPPPSTNTKATIERESLCAQFPMKLHKILEDAEKFNFSSAISWMDDGKAFVIIDKNRLENEIMPRYFLSGKWKSFQRSLNMWGFKCDRSYRVILPGPGYRRHHPLFVRGKLDLCYKMRRIQTDKPPVKRRSKKKETEPMSPQQPMESEPSKATSEKESESLELTVTSAQQKESQASQEPTQQETEPSGTSPQQSENQAAQASTQKETEPPVPRAQAPTQKETEPGVQAPAENPAAPATATAAAPLK